MLMSQAAISAGAISCPNLGTCANAQGAKSMTMPAARRSSIDIVDLPFLVDAPACDGVVVVDAAQPTFGGELSAGRLHHPGVVSGAALQDGGSTVPLPRRPKAYRSSRQDRGLQACGCPANSAVGRDIDLTNAAVTRPSETGDFIETWLLQRDRWCRARNHRFDLHWEHELPGLLVFEQDRVFRGLIFGHDRSRGEFQAAQPFDIHVTFKARHEQSYWIAV